MKEAKIPQFFDDFTFTLNEYIIRYPKKKKKKMWKHSFVLKMDFLIGN